MKLNFAIIAAVIMAALSACSATGMVVSEFNPKTGRHEKTIYTKYYSVGEWAALGQVGLEIWIDHEKTVGPLYGIQQATGALGPSDLHATGLITTYFVNLEQKPRTITGLMISSTSGKRASEQPQELQLAPRSVHQLVVGRVPIPNYETEVKLSVQYMLDGVPQSISPILRRRTETEMQHPRKDFPWFQPPYFPFEPPIANHTAPR